MKIAVACLCVLLFSVLVTADNIGILPGMLSLNPTTVTVSGVSSGGAFAMQLHVAYSSVIKGVGYFAAPPYRCAGNLGQIGAFECMEVPFLVDTNKLISDAKNYESQNLVDPLKNLADDRVWIFSGTMDFIVVQGTVKKLEEFYKNFASSSLIKTTYNVAANHAWITGNSADNSCFYLGQPYINNCNIDGSGEILNHVYFERFNVTAKPKTTQISENLLKFDQTPFGDESAGVLSYGYAYVPKACQIKRGNAANVTCSLHVALHGCDQNAQAIGTSFVTRNGMNDWAESNNIVVLYPQAAQIPSKNPKGCFDWWGYTDSNFANKNGHQMKAVRAMIAKLLGEKQ
jgi:hypothetical protein